MARAALGAALVSVVSLLALAGCGCQGSQPPPGSGQPDKFLFDRGTESLKDKKWLKAREYFRQLVDNYPQSPLRPDAKLGLGDTYLGENTVESLILAVNEFREFLTFYPTHPRADYAQFKLGHRPLRADARTAARPDPDQGGDRGVRDVRRALPEQRPGTGGDARSCARRGTA